MSLEQQVTALVEASNNLTGAVNGKISEIDQRVATAEQEFDDFIANADNRYVTRSGTMITVGGDSDKFYPVYIPANSTGIAQLQIARMIHNDRNWAGALSAQFYVQNNAWSGYPNVFVMDFLAIATHSSTPPEISADGFIADYKQGVLYIPGVLFWLRGNHSYFVTSSLKNFGPAVTHNDLVTTPVFNSDIHIFLSGYDVTSSGYNAVGSVKTERNTTLIPSLNYVRGV